MTAGEPNQRRIPEEVGAREMLLAGARVLVGQVPGLSMLTEMLLVHVTPPQQRRVIDFLNDLADRVHELEQRGACQPMPDLAADPVFVSTITEACASVRRTHLEEKRTALRNTVLNTAIGNPAIDDQVRAMLLRCIDELQPMHLVVLAFIDKPERVGNFAGPQVVISGTTFVALLEAKHPELANQRELLDLVFRDLTSRGLSMDFSPRASGTIHGIATSRSTALGRQLLALIREPT